MWWEICENFEKQDYDPSVYKHLDKTKGNLTKQIIV